MKIILVGAGSIGGTTATMLKEKGHDIEIVEVNPERAEKIRTEGITLTGALGAHNQKFTVYTSADELKELYDVCIIATKYFALSLKCVATTILRKKLNRAAIVGMMISIFGAVILGKITVKK